jgi:hypothetical protein
MAPPADGDRAVSIMTAVGSDSGKDDDDVSNDM